MKILLCYCYIRLFDYNIIATVLPMHFWHIFTVSKPSALRDGVCCGGACTAFYVVSAFSGGTPVVELDIYTMYCTHDAKTINMNYNVGCETHPADHPPTPPIIIKQIIH